jgi:hypothetical protein
MIPLTALVAHQGGWDEWGLPLGAVVVFAALVGVAARRHRDRSPGEGSGPG